MEHAEGTVELHKIIKYGKNIKRKNEKNLHSSCAQSIFRFNSGCSYPSLYIPSFNIAIKSDIVLSPDYGKPEISKKKFFFFENTTIAGEKVWKKVCSKWIPRLFKKSTEKTSTSFLSGNVRTSRHYGSGAQLLFQEF